MSEFLQYWNPMNHVKKNPNYRSSVDWRYKPRYSREGTTESVFVVTNYPEYDPGIQHTLTYRSSEESSEPAEEKKTAWIVGFGISFIVAVLGACYAVARMFP